MIYYTEATRSTWFCRGSDMEQFDATCAHWLINQVTWLSCFVWCHNRAKRQKARRAFCNATWIDVRDVYNNATPKSRAHVTPSWCNLKPEQNRVPQLRLMPYPGMTKPLAEAAVPLGSPLELILGGPARFSNTNIDSIMCAIQILIKTCLAFHWTGRNHYQIASTW